MVQTALLGCPVCSLLNTVDLTACVCRNAPTHQRSTLRCCRTVPNRSIQKEVGKTGCEVIRGHWLLPPSSSSPLSLFFSLNFYNLQQNSCDMCRQQWTCHTEEVPHCFLCPRRDMNSSAVSLLDNMSRLAETLLLFQVSGREEILRFLGWDCIKSWNNFFLNFFFYFFYHSCYNKTNTHIWFSFKMHFITLQSYIVWLKSEWTFHITKIHYVKRSQGGGVVIIFIQHSYEMNGLK